MSKLHIPKKTKVFVDQTVRERESARSKSLVSHIFKAVLLDVIVALTAMHQTFQCDLLQLRLHTSRSYIEALQSSLTPMTGSKHMSLNVTAQVTTCSCLHVYVQ